MVHARLYLEDRTEKRVKRTQREMISNYDEVASALIAAGFGSMLHDDSGEEGTAAEGGGPATQRWDQSDSRVPVAGIVPAAPSRDDPRMEGVDLSPGAIRKISSGSGDVGTAGAVAVATVVSTLSALLVAL